MKAPYRLRKSQTYDSANSQEYSRSSPESDRRSAVRASLQVQVGNNADARSSTSTLDSMGASRPIGYQERTDQALDIEQAIYLLQELKKSASPDELVALHKALLPTRDIETVTSPTLGSADDRMAFPTSPLVRRRSNLPPGLATRGRGGFAEDPLRRRGEPVPSVEPKKSTKSLLEKTSGWFQQTTSSNAGSLAALDLADEAAYPTFARAITPLDVTYSHIGAYRPGTLRIMNGAASPEPSIKGPPSILEEAYYSTSEGRPSIEVTRQGLSLDVVTRASGEDRTPIRERILQSDKALQLRMERAQRLSGSGTTSSKESIGSVAPLQIRRQVSSQSFDRESCVSPISDAETPRFQQRWNHRASHISTESPAVENEAVTHEGNKDALANFASRLSTVYDSDADDDDYDTPPVALSKLTGAAPEYNIGSAHTSDERGRSSLGSHTRPMVQQPIDSGYGSDTTVPQLQLQRMQPATVGSAKGPWLAPEASRNDANELDGDGSSNDAGSMYTFKEVLASPTLLSDEQSAAPNSEQAPQKDNATWRPPLLRLYTSKRSSAQLPATVLHGIEPITTTTPTPSSPEAVKRAAQKEEQLAKQQRKLQKPMPIALKQQRRQALQKLKEDKAKLDTIVLPQVPRQISATHSQRLLEQPSHSHLERILPNEESVDLQGLLASGPAELGGDTVHSPATIVPAIAEEPAPKRSFLRNRSKSRVRKSNDGLSDHESSEHERGKSRTRSGSRTPKRSSFDIRLGPFGKRTPQERPTSPTDYIIPDFTDFASIAQTLGSGSYDISTNQFKRDTSSGPRTSEGELQSPYMISTGILKAKSTKGMNEQAAVEMARLRSRDVAEKGSSPWHERPRMAIPKRKKTARSSSGPSQPSVSVESRFPEWVSKAPAGPPPDQRAHRTRSMYAESIPPMPELPADAEVRALKADMMVAKKMQTGNSPTHSARNSGDAHDLRTLEVTRKKEVLEINHINDKTLGTLESMARLKHMDVVNIQVRELAGSGSERSSAVDNDDNVAVEEQLQSPTHDAEHVGWPGWAHQAERWKQKRESIGAALAHDSSTPNAESPPVSRTTSRAPGIVVSRYITPLASEHQARAEDASRMTDTAAQHADIYRDLLDDDARPAKQDVARTDTAMSSQSSATFVTVKSWDPRPAKADVPRTDSAYSTRTYTSTTTSTTRITRASTRDDRAQLPSQKYTPYTPSQSSVVERSRAFSLARLTGTANTSSQSLDTSLQSSAAKTSPVVDRYSGGLEYGWERGAGFAGSAGTRHSGSENARRKSAATSERYGLDFSDVPIFLSPTGQ